MFSSPAQRANRRRLTVFGASFGVLCTVGLVYCFARPAIYQSSARIQVNPGSIQVETVVASGGTQGTNAMRSLVSEVQMITSRPLMQAVVASLPTPLRGPVSALGPDPVGQLQAGLDAQIAPDTNVVEVTSRGPDPQLAAAVVNGLIQAYRARLARGFTQSADDSVKQSSEEVARLLHKVLEKRRVIEEFSLRYNIVSSEPNDNEVLGRVRGQNDALNKASEKLAVAEGKFRAMSDAVAAGKPVTAASRTNVVLDNMEQRASQIREELSELGRSFTPEYLALDPKVRAQRARLAELERQIVTQRQASQQTSQSDQQGALAEAREEVNAAREAVSRLQQNVGASRGALNQFSARFNQYKTMLAELAPLEALLRDATQRNARLETGDLARQPSVQVIEPAYVPASAWRPLYARDAGIVVGGSLLSALLLMWLVELFNRVDPQPTILMAQPMAYSAHPQLTPLGAGPSPLALGRDNFRPMNLPFGQALLADAPMLRELHQDELRGLLENASVAVRLFVHLLLRGVSPEEALALRGHDVTLQARILRVGGKPARELPIDQTLHALLASLRLGDIQLVLASAGAVPAELPEMAAALLYAAHDANLNQPQEVTPAALRHTFAAFLARQGIRMADLARVMGHLSSEQAALYSSLEPAGRRQTLEEVDRLMPVVMTT